MAERLVPVVLWAPLARRADAVVDGDRLPMIPHGEHFRIDLPVGTRYLLSVDGADPRPDPRSARQPDGVHGPSQVFDTGAHQWRSERWAGFDARGRVFEEIHVGTFTPDGTLDAAIERLDHLVRLGVEVVELMPVVPFPGERGWGYDGVSLFAVHEAYGGPAALQRFVDAAHGKGLAVCLDVVFNHFGPAGNYAPVFAPYFTDKHHTPWGSAINLDDEYSHGVRAFIIDCCRRWLRDFRIDALRLDAVHALYDDSPTHLLTELTEAIDELRPSLRQRVTVIAESDLNQPATVQPREAGGLGLDAQWADDVHHALHAYLTGETFGYYTDFGSAQVLVKALEKVFVHDGEFSSFRGSDWGAPVPDDLDRRRFVTFTQNHDQVGNRGMGDRPDAYLDPGAVAAGAAVLLLSSFTPLLFQGQEWGTRRPFQFFTDHDAELGAAVTAGRLAEFAGHEWHAIYGPEVVIPDPQAESTFLASKLDWSEIDLPGHARMLGWYRRLVELRRAAPTTGQQVRADFGTTWFRMVSGAFTVLFTKGHEAEVQQPAGGRLVAEWGDVVVAGDVVRLAAHSVAVLQA